MFRFILAQYKSKLQNKIYSEKYNFAKKVKNQKESLISKLCTLESWRLSGNKLFKHFDQRSANCDPGPVKKTPFVPKVWFVTDHWDEYLHYYR